MIDCHSSNIWKPNQQNWERSFCTKWHNQWTHIQTTCIYWKRHGIRDQYWFVLKICPWVDVWLRSRWVSLTVFTDSYYTSLQLSLTLYKKGVNTCDKARTNRKGFPKDLFKTKREKQQGYHDYQSNRPI